jgi:hypothetical protein
MTLLSRLNEIKDWSWSDLIDLSDISDWIKTKTGINNIRIGLKSLDLYSKYIEIIVFTNLDSDISEYRILYDLIQDVKLDFPILSNYNVHLYLGSLDDLTDDIDIKKLNDIVGDSIIIEYNGVKQYLIFNVVYSSEDSSNFSILCTSVNNKYSNINANYSINYENIETKDIKYHIKHISYSYIYQLIKCVFIDSKLDYIDFINDINSKLNVELLSFNNLTPDEISLLNEYFITMDEHNYNLLDSKYKGLKC